MRFPFVPSKPAPEPSESLKEMVREFGRFAMQSIIDEEDRDAVIEECATNLAGWYPDNVSTNAFCAALRSMKSIARS